MDSGFYAACTALMARSQALDMVANNLANVSTPGFRAQHDVFRSLLAGDSPYPMSGLNRAVNNYSVLGDSQLDFAQGNLEKTGNDLGPCDSRARLFRGAKFRRTGLHAQW